MIVGLCVCISNGVVLKCSSYSKIITVLCYLTPAHKDGALNSDHTPRTEGTWVVSHKKLISLYGAFLGIFLRSK